MDEAKIERIAQGAGFIAALDQSGGSTPGALEEYGIARDAYADDDEMFELIQQMRERIVTAPPFTGDKVLGAILFEATLQSEIAGRPLPDYLWRERKVVSFLKVDQGMVAEADGVQLMKPMPKLKGMAEQAVSLGVVGTKMRSLISQASPDGIRAVAAQQFAFAREILGYGLIPIVEPEISIKTPNAPEAERLLCAAISRGLDTLSAGSRVMLKLTLPATRDIYAPFAEDPRVLRVVALSGGYSRDEACERLSRQHGMIASFSRALLSDLRVAMSDQQFDAALGAAIDQIYRASVDKAA